MALSEAQASRRPVGFVAAGSGLPLLTQITFSACRAPYPGGSIAGTSRWFARLPARAFPSIALAFPEPITGRHPRLNFSRFAQASLTLRPVDLLTHQMWAWSEGFDGTRYQAPSLLSYSGIPISS